MNHLGFSLLSTGPVPVSLLHLTVLFLPTLLLPEGWLPVIVKNNSSRSPKFNFSSSFCSYFLGHRKPYQEVAKWESGLFRANGDELQVWMVLQTLRGIQFTFGFAKWVCLTCTGIPSGWLFLFLTVIRRRHLADGEKSCLVPLTELNQKVCVPWKPLMDLMAQKKDCGTSKRTHIFEQITCCF